MPTKIAFVSCAYATERKQQPAWAEIRAAKPDLLILLGDNAYMSWAGSPYVAKDWNFESLESCYRAQFEVVDFKWLVDHVPTLAIWDDHDAGPNDTVGSTAPRDFLAATREKFDRWMSFARNSNRPHMYCSYLDIPDVRIIMLDVRTYRTLHDASNSTLLGPDQEAWLWRQLDPAITPQRKITIVCSGTGFTQGAKKQKVMDYRVFAKELKSRLEFRAGGADDVGRRSLFLAGDIHRNFCETIEGTKIHEALSSGVACYAAGSGDNLIGDNECDNWALMTLGDAAIDLEFFGRPDSPDRWYINNFKRRININDWSLSNA